ncbi:hypothetical protein WKY82_09920 [Gordonia malaquae]|uniref:hypothetical protein n=1 Tax=Gordonia malaquae TaxID=410332 RepID=UPI0030C79AE4
MFDAHVLKVLISTPSDTSEEVAEVTKAIHDWNADRAENAQTILLPRFWKAHAVPAAGAGGQTVIDSQLVDDADIVLAIFDSRLGKATDDAVSGTAHEIDRAIGSGKPVHVWFSTEDVPHDVDVQELTRLRKFKSDLSKRALHGEYNSPSDLSFKVRSAVEADVHNAEHGKVTVKRLGEHAKPRVHVIKSREQVGFDSKGAPKFRTRAAVVLENKSDSVTAENLTINFGELDEWVMRQNADPLDLPPDAPLRWGLMLAFGSPDQTVVKFQWDEGGEQHSFEQPLTV